MPCFLPIYQISREGGGSSQEGGDDLPLMHSFVAATLSRNMGKIFLEEVWGFRGFLMQPQRHSPQNNPQGERWRSKTKCFITCCQLCFLSSLIEGVCIYLHMKATQLDAILLLMGGTCIPLTRMWLVPHQAGRVKLGRGTSCISEGSGSHLEQKKKKKREQGRGMGPTLSQKLAK